MRRSGRGRPGRRHAHAQRLAMRPYFSLWNKSRKFDRPAAPTSFLCKGTHPYWGPMLRLASNKRRISPGATRAKWPPTYALHKGRFSNARMALVPDFKGQQIRSRLLRQPWVGLSSVPFLSPTVLLNFPAAQAAMNYFCSRRSRFGPLTQPS
jgi:hypothetical protein